MTRSRWFPAAVWLLLAGAAPLAAQDEAAVETLARLLAAEDARDDGAPILSRALADPDSQVRAQAALAVGRIRPPNGDTLLAPLLYDPNPDVSANAAFALGLLGDTAVIPRLQARARDPAPLPGSTALEMIAAAARTPSSGAATLVTSVLERSLWSDRDDASALRYRAAEEAWRLGDLAPVTTLLGLARDPNTDLQAAALFSLGRLRTPAAAPRLVDALRDRSAAVRALAARALSPKLVAEAGLPAEAVTAELVRAAHDPEPGVRIQALRTLATYPKAPARGLLALLEDPVPNVQVQAAATLAALADPVAGPDLERVVAAKGSLARQEGALVALATVDAARFAAVVPPWESSPDWHRRAAVARAWGSGNALRVPSFLSDRDPRVIAAALQSWSDHATPGDTLLVQVSRGLTRHADAAVRSLATDQIAATPQSGDLALFLGLYRAAQRDTIPDAALAALNGVLAVARLDSAQAESVERDALAELPVPRNPVIRLWAEQHWPGAATAWGPAYPLRSARDIDGYRDIVRRLVLRTSPDRTPRLTLEVEQLGKVVLELWGPEAPLTVANFLQLVERHFFDGLRFHRVVPGFVVQTGDPRGDGWGGSLDVIRDELNRHRYGPYVVGMALSGPDTGTSQWFITLATQAHLDGNYTAFGKVVDGVPVLLRITQGDQIRSIHR